LSFQNTHHNNNGDANQGGSGGGGAVLHPSAVVTQQDSSVVFTFGAFATTISASPDLPACAAPGKNTSTLISYTQCFTVYNLHIPCLCADAVAAGAKVSNARPVVTDEGKHAIAAEPPKPTEPLAAAPSNVKLSFVDVSTCTIDTDISILFTECCM
jgi:hypothetical protein